LALSQGRKILFHYFKNPFEAALREEQIINLNWYLCLTRENMVFGAGKQERRYHKIKNGAKNSEGSKNSSGGGAARREGEGRLPPGEPL
jgi:hypothetical protein